MLVFQRGCWCVSEWLLGLSVFQRGCWCFRKAVECCWCVSERVLMSFREAVECSLGVGWCVSERVLSVVGIFQRGC